MTTQQWGPLLWHIIHTISKKLPSKLSQKDIYYTKQLINIIAYIIPCFKCQKHYMTNIIKHKPIFDSNEAIFKWTVKIHNLVNKHNNKSIVTLNQAKKMTEDKLSNNKINKLILFLSKESSNLNISKNALLKFVNIIKYFYKYC